MKKKWIASLFSLLLLSPFSYGQESSEAASKEMKAAKKAVKKANQKMPKLRSVKGEVVELESVKVEGSKSKHRVLLLNPPQSDFNIVVDLGPVDKTDLLSIKTGEELAVQGQFTNVNDKGLMLAKKVRYKGNTLVIQDW